MNGIDSARSHDSASAIYIRNPLEVLGLCEPKESPVIALAACVRKFQFGNIASVVVARHSGSPHNPTATWRVGYEIEAACISYPSEAGNPLDWSPSHRNTQ